MRETLFMEEEEQLDSIRNANKKKKDLSCLNRKNLSSEEMDELFCEF